MAIRGSMRLHLLTYHWVTVGAHRAVIKCMDKCRLHIRSRRRPREIHETPLQVPEQACGNGI